jgi:AraC-like DNA-binding protein
MVAHARPLLTSPRVELEAPAGPHAKLRLWSAEAAYTRPPPPAAHAGVELTWIVAGQVGYQIGARRFDVEAGRAMLVPSGVDHATLFPTSMRGSALWIDVDAVAQICDALGRPRAVASGLVEDAAKVAALGAVLTEEAKSADRGALLAADAILEAMVVLALRGASSEGSDRSRTPLEPTMARVVRYIEASYAEPLTASTMARVANMSRFHFSRRFRDATGRSPYRYLVDVRLERAAELLRRGRCGVTEAALAVGFSDPSRFARMFRRRFGAAPATWRNAHRSSVLHLLPSH